MRDPLDVLGRYFWEIIGCWSLLLAIVFLWLGYRIMVGIAEKRQARATPRDPHSSR